MMFQACSKCFAPLTADEIEFYEGTCNACEGEWSERCEAWRHGGEDPELDEQFDPRCPDCGEPLEPLPEGCLGAGLLGCLCTWGGRIPTVDEIVSWGEEVEKGARH